jgi:acyl-CoA thioesterase II
MCPSLAELIAVEEIGKDCFVSKENPRPEGNLLPIAYGGCTISVAVFAAYQTVAPNFHVYSLTGLFLGPAKTDRKLHCTVRRTRDTRAFTTRHVVVWQTQDDGSERGCVECFADFQVEEAALLTYSAAPAPEYGYGPYDDERVAAKTDIMQRALEDGRITRASQAAYYKLFKMMTAFFDWRLCLHTVIAQNVLGLAKSAPTTQDSRPIADKTAAEWVRLQQPLSSPAENAAALAFFMDGGLSFLPLQLNKMDWADTSAVSSLDFALRFIRPNVDLRSWHLRERKTIAAAVGRTYSESKVWNEKGDMVAVMTQSCILRPPQQKQKQKANSKI